MLGQHFLLSPVNLSVGSAEMDDLWTHLLSFLPEVPGLNSGISHKGFSFLSICMWPCFIKEFTWCLLHLRSSQSMARVESYL